MIKLPKRICIGGHRIPVRYGQVDSDAVGEFRHGDNFEIVIRKGMSDDLTRETLTHEIFEAINHCYEMGLPHAKIQQLGLALHQILDQL